MFNWRAFLDQRRIPYVERGANVAAGNIAVRCPWCGHGDESQHLEISLTGKGWRCWRNFNHRGRSPVRLIAALVPCSTEQAATIAGVTATTLPDNWLTSLHAKLRPPSPKGLPGSIIMLGEFRNFLYPPGVIGTPYVNYLRARGFADDTIYALTQRFNLRYAPSGAFRGRIIFPVTCEGQLKTWTGRSIAPGKLPRYRALSPDPALAEAMDVPTALGPISNYLLFHDLLRNVRGEALYIVEGPMDALKLWTLGEPHGIYATCLFTTRASTAQIGLLHGLLPRFRQRVLLLDKGAEAHAMRLAASLASLDVRIRWLPEGVDDPGELTNIDALLD